MDHTAQEELPTLATRVDWLLGAPWVDARIGDRIGDYLLLDAIGQGGYAIVWRAEDIRSHTHAAIKILSPFGFPDASRKDAAIRFYEGTNVMRKLSSAENIVRIIDGPFFSGCYLWFAMEFVEQGDLSKALQRGELSNDEKVKIVDDLIKAVNVAHKSGIRHRDIRPQNILLKRSTNGLTAVLADFDIAYYEHVLKARESTSQPQGVSRYMPPEIFGASQQDLKNVLRRYENDLYALCVVVFDMFSNDASLPSDRTEGAFASVLPKEIEANLRNCIARLCAQGLKFNPSHRFRTIAEISATWQPSLPAAPKREVTRVVREIIRFGTVTIIAAICAAGLRYINRSDPNNSTPTIGVASANPDRSAISATPTTASAGSAASATRITDTLATLESAAPIGSAMRPCVLPAFRHAAAQRYVAMSDTEEGAIVLRKKLGQLFAKESGSGVWSTALHHEKSTQGKRSKWLVKVDSMAPGTANDFCDWLLRCQEWPYFCTATSPFP